MRVEAEYVLLISTIAALAGSGIGWNIRNGKVKEILLAFAHKENRLADQAKAVISEIKKECDAENDRARSLEERLRAAKAQNSKLVAKDKEFELALQQLKATNKSLHDTYTLAISKIKQECALLPSVVEWASQIQEIIDAAMVDSLARKDRPALKAAEEIKEARASARNWKKEADTLRNTVSLYEVEAPWLVELADYSVGEIVEGLRQEAELQKAAISGNDPALLFVSAAEWAGLTEAKRTQLALDRYWEYRKRNAWAAGIQYERFVGYSYETIGFNVIYQGATKGVNDQGIDLICAKNSQIHLIQCKRLSVEKGFPVRENVVAQIFGASLYYAHAKGLNRDCVIPVIVTTYELSKEAKNFADALGVLYKERDSLERYPCIKCNISASSREKIYHLPFDQQYDVTRVDPSKGECYAMSVSDAERLGFRRASRWYG